MQKGSTYSWWEALPKLEHNIVIVLWPNEKEGSVRFVKSCDLEPILHYRKETCMVTKSWGQCITPWSRPTFLSSNEWPGNWCRLAQRGFRRHTCVRVRGSKKIWPWQQHVRTLPATSISINFKDNGGSYGDRICLGTLASSIEFLTVAHANGSGGSVCIHVELHCWGEEVGTRAIQCCPQSYFKDWWTYCRFEESAGKCLTTYSIENFSWRLFGTFACTPSNDRFLIWWILKQDKTV